MKQVSIHIRPHCGCAANRLRTRLSDLHQEGETGEEEGEKRQQTWVPAAGRLLRPLCRMLGVSPVGVVVPRVAPVRTPNVRKLMVLKPGVRKPNVRKPGVRRRELVARPRLCGLSAARRRRRKRPRTRRRFDISGMELIIPV